MNDLRALYDLATGGERSAAFQVGRRIVLAIGADFLIMLSLLHGLAERRAGRAPSQQAVFFLVAVGVFYWSSLSVNRTLSERFNHATRVLVGRITRRLPRMPLLEFRQLGAGTLMTRIMGDGNRVASCRQAVFGTLSGMLRLGLGAIFTLSISSEASALAFAGLVLMGTIVVGQMWALQAGFGALADDDARMYDLLRGQIRGGVPLKVHRPRSSAVGQALASISERVRTARVALFDRFFERQYAGDALVYGLLGINVFVLPLVADVDGEDVRELNMAILWLVLAAVKLVTGLPRIASAGSALARLTDLDERLAEERIDPPVPEADRDGGLFRDFRRIEVNGLAFEYPSSPDRHGFPLGPLDLAFDRGELVFIVGHNGSGKSTFARVFAGLYPAAAGEIRVDGVPVTPEKLGAWRALFATIFVEHCLFERVLGLDEAALARAPELFDMFGIGDKTAIVEGRITNRALSTGQKKRLAMALTRLGDKPILVLDEWAADQDPEFRATFYDVLLPALRTEDRLIVVITHDDAYFDRADRCLQFADGQLAEVPR